MLGKTLVFIGVLFVLAGLLLWQIGPRLPHLGFRGLPGDLHWQSGPVKIYFPIVTCLALSAILTLLWWLWRWWAGR